MLRFRRMLSLQKFAAVHGLVHNHFNQDCILYSRLDFKLNRAAALASAQSNGLRCWRTKSGSHSFDGTA